VLGQTFLHTGQALSGRSHGAAGVRGHLRSDRDPDVESDTAPVINDIMTVYFLSA